MNPANDPIIVSWISNHWWVLVLLCIAGVLWERYAEEQLS